MLCLNRLQPELSPGRFLIIPCEVAAKSVIPALRAMVARELMEEYRMKQKLVAERLGVTQAAISKYRHQVRGEAVQLEAAREVRNMTKEIAATIAQDPRPRQHHQVPKNSNPALARTGTSQVGVKLTPGLSEYYPTLGFCRVRF